MKSFAAALLLLCQSNDAFYIPGVAPQTFQKGEAVDMKVNSMTSTHTQIPRDYYRLPFCAPAEGPVMASENLGEFLTGNKIQSSAYVINMLTPVKCGKVCQVELDEVTARKLTKHIGLGYHNNWIIDNLPSANLGRDAKGVPRKHYAGGFPLGFFEGKQPTKKTMPNAFVSNHVNIMIDYHKREEGYRVVGFAVEPLSIKHAFEGDYKWDGESKEGMSKPLSSCDNNADKLERNEIKEFQTVNKGDKIIYTYNVIWNESEVAWSSRWDVYLSEDHLIPAQVHWYSISNSIFVVVFLSALVISVLVKNLKRDIDAYNEVSLFIDGDEEVEDEKEESGWKLVHADVFRPPENMPMIFCIFVGSGVQVGVTLMSAICLSAVGFVSPARRGSLINVLLVFYMLCGIISGYVSSRLYKTFRGRQWQLCTAATALLLPGVAFFMFLIFNIVLFFLQSSASAPLLDVVILAAMWCCVSVPLVFLGAYAGYGKEGIVVPTVTSTIARAIPEQPLHMDPRVIMLGTGIVPFSCAYVELFFIMSSLWMDQYYYVFGFTFIVYLILLVTCAEMTLLTVYYQLCAENHRWWWLSFFSSGCTALYFFAYSIYWFKTLHASKMVMTYLLYFGYMSLLSFMMMLVFGAVGSMTTFWFVRTIFGTIKVD